MPSEELYPEILDALGRGFESKYPTRKPISVTQSGDADPTQAGWAFLSQSESDVIQLRPGMFSYHHLMPYKNWEYVRDSARDAWNRYRQIVSGVTATSFVLRYINRLEIPGLEIEINDYLRTGPMLGEGLPQRVNGAFVRIGVPLADLGAQSTIVVATVPPVEENHTSIVLDLAFEKAWSGESDEDMWASIELLKERRTAFFEGSITNKCREMFT